MSEQGLLASEMASPHPLITRLRSEGFEVRLGAFPDGRPAVDVGPKGGLTPAQKAYVRAAVARDRDQILAELHSEAALAERVRGDHLARLMRESGWRPIALRPTPPPPERLTQGALLEVAPAPAPTPSAPVPYAGALGDRLIVVKRGRTEQQIGKVVHLDGASVFYRDVGPQHLVRFCDGLAIDDAVLFALAAAGVADLWYRLEETLYAVPVARMREKAIRREMNGRPQHILPRSYWTARLAPDLPRVPEHRKQVITLK